MIKEMVEVFIIILMAINILVIGKMIGILILK